jgi:hypothetical protein
LPFERELEMPMDSSTGRTILGCWHNDHPAEGSSAAMLLLAAVLFVSIPMAQAAENTPRPQPPLEAGADRVRVQPRAKEFASPNPQTSAAEPRAILTLCIVSSPIANRVPRFRTPGSNDVDQETRSGLADTACFGSGSGHQRTHYCRAKELLNRSV